MTEKEIKTYFIYEEEAFREIDEAIIEHIKASFDELISYQNQVFDELNDTCKVAVFITDEAINSCILKAHEKGFSLGFLPHPKAIKATNSFHIEEDLAQAVDEFLDIEQLVESDLLYCNEMLINNYMVIGDIITEITKKDQQNSTFQKAKNFVQFAKKINRIRPKSLSLKADDKDEFETAAAGILITPHAKNAVISRIILENSFLNDGLFHCLIFSPRSFTKVLFAYIKMLFSFKEKKGTTHLSFLGHIKTDELKISYPKEESCTLDGEMIKAKTFHIKIDGHFKLVPSKKLLFTNEEKGNQRVFKISQLPKGKDLIEMLSKKLPFIEHASTSEFKDLFTVLRDNAETKASYIVLMVLSTVLATFGLFANSNPIVIGAMILAPLISPVISLSM